MCKRSFANNTYVENALFVLVSDKLPVDYKVEFFSYPVVIGRAFKRFFLDFCYLFMEFSEGAFFGREKLFLRKQFVKLSQLPSICDVKRVSAFDYIM